MIATTPDLSQLVSLAFEFLTQVRCGENPHEIDYLRQIESEESKKVFLSLIKADYADSPQSTTLPSNL